MEGEEDSSGSLNSSYNKLIHQEDSSEDNYSLNSNQDRQQVSVLMVRPESRLDHHKLLTVSLALLAVLLLAGDVGLGVYYKKLTDGQDANDISSELAKLRASHDSAIQSRDEARKQLESEINGQQLTKWEIEHQNRRTKYYEELSDKIQMKVSTLKSHIPMIKDGCRHCPPGWTFMNLLCYYFPFSEVMQHRSWNEARQFCRNQGGDLAVVDTREKLMAITSLINNYQRPSGPRGFWIGLTDVEEEGSWKWLDGTRLIEGYWNDGEPNNSGNEDCGATYPNTNPFKAWNDAPCNHGLKWICQRTPGVNVAF
ncbi:C-type lectin domain family 4 member M-like isoform X1 [Pungitius pungitius]|uniref:C-type lectin domain family 4 member M-like isoform X1 n=1 Tax=Pungitius pungitius TaxID=134920 RepID=UPI0018870FFE|nr:C-type lectin domain family 4 member M-like isoform X1 [Pungitius pungitius]